MLGDSVELCIVGNKIDKEKDRHVDASTAQQYVYLLFETAAKYMYNRMYIYVIGYMQQYAHLLFQITVNSMSRTVCIYVIRGKL